MRLEEAPSPAPAKKPSIASPGNRRLLQAI
jgi:hypothetical protein